MICNEIQWCCEYTVTALLKNEWIILLTNPMGYNEVGADSINYSNLGSRIGWYKMVTGEYWEHWSTSIFFQPKPQFSMLTCTCT